VNKSSEVSDTFLSNLVDETKTEYKVWIWRHERTLFLLVDSKRNFFCVDVFNEILIITHTVKLNNFQGNTLKNNEDGLQNFFFFWGLQSFVVAIKILKPKSAYCIMKESAS
jgi:hypothetical protein